MSKSFTSIVDMQTYMQDTCNKAVETTCNRLLGKLQELIFTEYYEVYFPEYYDRNYQFYKSAVAKMISETTGRVLMDASLMSYDFSGWGWAWNGEMQVVQANQGSHGGYSTEESLQHHYWNSFIEYCNKNAVTILREELEKVGIKTVK